MTIWFNTLDGSPGQAFHVTLSSVELAQQVWDALTRGGFLPISARP